MEIKTCAETALNGPFSNFLDFLLENEVLGYNGDFYDIIANNSSITNAIKCRLAV